MSSTQEQLRILSIFHYVVGGLYALFGSFGLLYVGMGLMFTFAPASMSPANGQSGPPAFFGMFFAVFGGIFVLVGWGLGFLTVLSGRYINQRKKRMFSVVMGCINCAFIPFGTVLGVFDIILLGRDDVRALYGEPPAL
jgi:hypothetical protein